MKVQDLIQGSPEWLAYRATHFNASDAPAMMGCSPYKTRAQLLRELHTGVVPEVDPGTQKRYDNGHRVEALARPLAEEIIGEELYPVTGSNGRLSASFDGLTLDETQGFEHKALNADIRAAFKAMDRIAPGAPLDDAAECRLLPLYHRVQMEQQLHVSGAKRILFVSSEWDADGALVEELHCWYYPDDELRGAILAGWAQFEHDLAAYVLPAQAEAAPVGRAPDTLPALRIEVTGAVTASNLAEFKATALTAIRSVNRELRTDADFADADKAVKWCADVEARLKAAKEHALSQTADIDALFKTLDDISAEARTVRLDLDKLVKRRKDEVREQAVTAARKALDAHIATLQAELAPMRLQPVAADFAGAIKGLRSIASMQDALDTALAGAKIAADAQARGIRANVAHFNKTAVGMEFLFHDLAQLVHKAPDDFELVLAGRIRKQMDLAEAQEKQRQADEAARIAAAEQRAREQAEREAQARHIQDQQAVAVAAQAVAAATAPAAPAPAPMAQAPAPAVPAPAAAPRADEPATLTLGAVCDRLDVKMTAQFVADTLNVKATRTERGAHWFTETQFRAICLALASHARAMATLYEGEPA
jgi:predicted phage-related endonuclease